MSVTVLGRYTSGLEVSGPPPHRWAAAPGVIELSLCMTSCCLSAVRRGPPPAASTSCMPLGQWSEVYRQLTVRRYWDPERVPHVCVAALHALVKGSYSSLRTLCEAPYFNACTPFSPATCCRS